MLGVIIDIRRVSLCVCVCVLDAQLKKHICVFIKTIFICLLLGLHLIREHSLSEGME